MTMSHDLTPPPSPFVTTIAYSDASMQPYAPRAVLAAVVAGETLVREAQVMHINEAELLAAELAVSHAPHHLPLRLHLDNLFALQALTGQHGHELAFGCLALDIHALAQTRGITLEVMQVRAYENPAHQPAIERYRSLECRPRQVYELKTKGPLVRVRGPGVNFHGVYDAPAGFHAVCELAQHLPADTIALVKGLMPFAAQYWHTPKCGGSGAVKRAKAALKILAEKNSDIQFWKG